MNIVGDEMFVTEKLNVILEIIQNQKISEKLEKVLMQQHVNLEATLLRAKVLREFSKIKIQYIVQSAIEQGQSSLAFLFSPFILANLNQTVIYHSQDSASVFNILSKYYQVEKKQSLKIDDVLEALKIYLDFTSHELNEVEFLYFSLIRALSRADVSQIFLVTHLKLNTQKVKEIENFFKVKIHCIQIDTTDSIPDSSELNMRKLLFKNKDQNYIELCERFSRLNAQLLCANGSYKQEQAIQLVEDMFYSEHIYEKLSVYAEYMQTCLQQGVYAYKSKLFG